eukprot:TRINITY_DN1387_c0_g1_i1.p2 TRINITY_DN1387_c0_g1~~TRINITY_DN1387_c0_g1_i1.p2  ORF type:complete len:311 (-),score=72.55 TRINITY_DN1387_c0_g1_i1:271-1203(-)
MEKAETMRAANEIDPDTECPIVVKVKTSDNGALVRLSMVSLRAMGELHVAAERLQVFCSAVDLVQSAAVKLNARVPTFYGHKMSTMGELGTAVMRVVLKSNPSATVWRTDVLAADAAYADVQLSSSALVANMGTASMRNEFLAVNQTILRRWVTQNMPRSITLPCCFFVPLLAPPQGAKFTGAVTASVNAAAAEGFRLAGDVHVLASVCIVDSKHWIAFSIDLCSKTVTQYDSGRQFESLRDDVAEALVRVQAMAKRLRVLMAEAASATLATQLLGDPLEGKQEDNAGDTVCAHKGKSARKPGRTRRSRH